MTHPAAIRGARPLPTLLSIAPFLALLAILGIAGPAAAHSDLRSSTPTSGARLATPPKQVILIFSDEVEPRFTYLSLTAGDGRLQKLSPKVQGTQVIADVDKAASQATGRWSVGYRVVSADGHPISGVVTFTVDPPAQPAPSPSSSVASSPLPSQPPTTAMTAPPTARVIDNQAAGSVPGFSSIAAMMAGSAAVMVVLGALLWRFWRRSLR